MLGALVAVRDGRDAADTLRVVAVLTLTYGTMSAGKTTLALQLHWQLSQSGRRVELWTFGDRSGEGRLTSRVGLSAPARAVAPGEDLTEAIERLRCEGVAALVVDEVQFATSEQVDALGAAVDYYGSTCTPSGWGPTSGSSPSRGPPDSSPWPTR